MKHLLPLSLRIIRGAIGKEFVIKRYKYGKIKTKFPDMSRIIPSLAQRKCRDVFKEAVAYAKSVIADEHQKKAWQKRIRIRNGVYNAAIRYYMLKQKHAKENAMLEAQRLLRAAFRYVPLLTYNDQQQTNRSAINAQPAQVCASIAVSARPPVLPYNTCRVDTFLEKDISEIDLLETNYCK